MDDNDLTPWNPAHFGHTDFQKESDGQLTIFFEDAHEPPDPDDFASIADYEIAWTEWEQKQTLPQQEDKQMTGQFEAAAIEWITCNEEQTAKLKVQKEFFATSELSPDKILALIIASVAKMEELEVEGDWIGDWGEDIYKAIFGTTSNEEFKARFAKELASFESQKKIELSYRDSLKNLQEIQNKLVVSVAELTKELSSEKRKVLELQRSTAIVSSELCANNDDEIECLKKEVERLKLSNIVKESAIDEVRDVWIEKENQWYKEREELEAKIEILESRHESDRVLDVDQLVKQRDEALDNFVKLTEASLRVSEELKGVRASLAIANKEAFDARKELADLTMQKIDGNSKDTEEPFKIDLLKKVSDLTIERNTALERLAELEKLNAANVQGIAQLSQANQELCEKLNKLSSESRFKQVFEEVKEAKEASPVEIGITLSNNESITFELNDHVQVVQIEDDEDLLHRHGKIIGIMEDQITVLFHETEEHERETTRMSAHCLKILDGNSDIRNQEIVSEFLRKLDRISRVDKLDWQKIKQLPLNLETMKELGLQIKPKSKTHDYLLQQMPAMCAGYISETGDRSDLEWLPKQFAERVEYLLKMEALGNADDKSAPEEKTPRATSLSEVKPTVQSGDTVRHVDLDSVCTVLDVNGKWLNVQDDDGFTDMRDISDVELVEELAA